MVVNVTAEFLHQDFHFRERHAGTACDLHENVGRITEKPAAIHERTLQRLRERIVRAVVGIRFSETEETTTVRIAQRGQQIVETDPDQAGALEQIDNRAHALADGHIRRREGLMNAGFRRDHVPHFVVLKTNHGVGIFMQPRQRFERLRGAAFAFERKRQSGEANHHRASFARQLRDHGRRPRTRPAAQSGADEDHPRVRQILAQFIRGFDRGVVAQLGIAARAQAARHRPAELHLVRGDGAGERLHIGIHGQEIGALESVEHDAIKRIGAGTADADYFDGDNVVLLFGQAVVAAELDHRMGFWFIDYRWRSLPTKRLNRPRCGRSACTACA